MKYIFNKKFLFLIPLLIAIPISVVLVQKKQEMRKKAVESEVTTETLENWLTDVPAATGSKYGAMDDKGNRLDTIKIIENPAGGYLGVYHTLINGIFSVKLAKSSDLLNWTYFTDLDSYAAQPAIAKLSDNGFLVVYEKWFSGQASIGFRYYPNQNSLFAGSFSQEFYAPYTLSNLQGTPNIYSVNLSPNISNSTIEIGFHFYDWNKKGDRQAGGKLVNFSSWSAQQETPWNSQLEQMGIKFIGDRDKFSVGGKQYNIIETNTTLLGDSNFWCSWKPYLYDYEQNIFSPLNIKTHKGSRSFGNPTVTPLTSPSGKPAIVVTLFNFCAASGEAGGPLIYYKEYSTSLLPTNTPTPIGTPTPTPTLTPSLTPTPSPTPFPTPTPSPTPTPIPTPTSTPTPTPTPSPTPTPTPKPTATPTPTPIPTPTSTPTPTPTQAPDTANLTFKVKFQGINQQRPDKTVKITLTKAGNTVATFENEGVASDGNGVYTGKIMNINPDTYNIFIKGWAHLQKKFEGIILTEGENIQNWSGVELLAGDAAGDDKINIQDFRILVEDYLKSESPADFNLDRKVNIQDFRFIVENYLKEGEK